MQLKYGEYMHVPNPKTQLQGDLMEDQLPGLLNRILDARGTIVSVTLGGTGALGLATRYNVIYHLPEPLEVEIRT